MRSILVVLAAAILPAAASAQDATWTGFYTGAQIGAFDAETEIPQTLTQVDTAFGGATDVLIGGQSGSIDGGAIGLHAGYRFQFGSSVFGAVAEAEATDAGESFGTESSFDGTFDRGSFEIDRTARVMAQYGVAGGRSLIYGQAGIAYVEGRARTTEVDGTGFAVGLGVDHAITDRVVFGVDYLHQRFDDFDSLEVDNPSGRTLPSQDLTFETDALRAKLSVRF